VGLGISLRVGCGGVRKCGTPQRWTESTSKTWVSLGLTRETNLARRTDFDRHDEIKLTIPPLFRDVNATFVSLVQVASGFFVACLNGTSDLLKALAMLDGI
jgi:hypothetical protein